MSFSKCSKCDSSFFEVKEAEPSNSAYKIIFVQCSSCGAVVGTMPFYDAGVISKDNQEQISAIKQQLNSLEHNLAQIVQTLQRR